MHSVLTRATAAIDRRVARFVARQLVRRGAPPRPLNGDARAMLVAAAGSYNAGTLGVPSPFFPAPSIPEIALEPIGDGPLGTQVVDLSFASAYQPFLPVARDLYFAWTENLTTHARWWTSLPLRASTEAPRARAESERSFRGRPTIIALHGLGGGNYWWTERAFAVPYWLRHGYDVVAFQLPFHGRRAAGSGTAPAWPSPNPLRTNEGFGHTIYDLRALAMWLRARGASAVGAMGMSLGSYAASLWASVAGPNDPGGIDFAVAMIPAVSLARLMWLHGKNSSPRRQAIKAGISEELLAEAFAVHAPMTRPPRLASDRLFVVGGLGDQITPPDQAAALAAHWHTDVLWFHGGHVAQLGRSDAFRTVRRAIGNAGFSGREFRP